MQRTHWCTCDDCFKSADGGRAMGKTTWHKHNPEGTKQARLRDRLRNAAIPPLGVASGSGTSAGTRKRPAEEDVDTPDRAKRVARSGSVCRWSNLLIARGLSLQKNGHRMTKLCHGHTHLLTVRRHPLLIPHLHCHLPPILHPCHHPPLVLHPLQLHRNPQTPHLALMAAALHPVLDEIHQLIMAIRLRLLKGSTTLSSSFD